MVKISKQLVLILLWVCTVYAYNIDDFGAKPDDASYKTAKANGKAFLDAVLAANLSTTDKTVIVSRGKNYTMLPYAIINDIYNVTIEINGIINAWCENVAIWPFDERNNPLTLIAFRNTVGMTIHGSGLVEGNGLAWWWLVWITGVDNRPNLLDMEICKDTLIEDLTFQNAPQFHLNLMGALNMTVRNLRIYVNDTAVASLPTFPLNTDGIDISGRDVVMYNLTIENYDDAVAVKPVHTGQYPYSNCTENILIEDCRVKLGVGMSIGSVSPDQNVNCVRDVTVRNVRFDEPFKAIYIKPNPGNVGMGLVERITYENIEIYNSIWWAIFIGTQQQKQPHGGDDTGCSFLYPLPGQTCLANPHVTVRDITLRNVTIHGGLLSPGIFLCNESNPCTNLVFDGLNVYNKSSWPVPEGFLCINFHGHAVNSNLVPDCLKNSTMTQLSDSEIVDLQNSASRRHFKKRKGKGIFNHHN